ncbi:MAG: PHP domain-containing protein [Candidatus Obscuribacterales bacterium]
MGYGFASAEAAVQANTSVLPTLSDTLFNKVWQNQSDKNAPAPGGAEVLLSAAKQIPSATVEMAQEAWDHPWDTAKHVGKELATSAGIGMVLGAVIPGKGVATKVIAAAFTVPMVWHGTQRLRYYWDEGNQAGANADLLGHSLARETVSSTANLGLSLAGGMAGGYVGGRIATSETTAGFMAQSAQRSILRGENALLLRLYGAAESATAPGALAGTGTGAVSRAAGDMTELPTFAPQKPMANTRLQQLLQQPEEYNMYYGSLHGHSRYSDGMGLPKDIYARAKENGIDFTAITDHNHLAARDGVKPGDPRIPDQAGTPILVASPKQYAQTFADAAAATKPGEFVGLVGTEHGTIGKVGADHMGGVNHINIMEVPSLFEAVRQPKNQNFIMRGIRRTLGMSEETIIEPDLIKIRDGDYKALVDHLDLLKDTTGERPVIQLNHPRPKEDFNMDLDPKVRGRDYGRKSFKSPAEWRERFGKYASQIEVITGEALNPKPTDVVKSWDLVPEGLARYTDEGLYLSPTFGKDFHFGNPEGSPAGTGIFAKSLDKESIMDALRNRRTIATTSRENLSGHMTVNNRFQMGSILDETAVHDINVNVKVGGNVVPDAKYTVNLHQDPRIGDGKLARVVETKEMTGQEIIDAGNSVNFSEVKHTIGNKSAYWIEIQRVDPISGITDHMWTAPVWVQPHGSEGVLGKGIFGIGNQLFTLGS